MTNRMQLANGPDVARRLGNLIPNLDDDLVDVNRDIAEDLVTTARGTLSGAFGQRAAGGLRAVGGTEPAVEWGGGQVFSGGGSIDALWPAAEWGSSIYPQLPSRRESGHLFAAITAGERQRMEDWVDTTVKSMRATVH